MEHVFKTVSHSVCRTRRLARKLQVLAMPYTIHFFESSVRKPCLTDGFADV